jgi:putative GTP pyrophosphokinase
MESRLKSPDTILEKMYRRNYSIDLNTLKEYIYDIAGVRVICKYVNDIYHIINLLREQKDLKIKLIKDYIKNPKPTGYRSIHVVFNMEIYIDSTIRVVPVEIQFRTIAMDMWASLEHELRYKSNNKLSEEEGKALSKYADDLYNIDVKMQDLYLSIDSTPNE